MRPGGRKVGKENKLAILPLFLCGASIIHFSGLKLVQYYHLFLFSWEHKNLEVFTTKKYMGPSTTGNSFSCDCHKKWRVFLKYSKTFDAYKIIYRSLVKTNALIFRIIHFLLWKQVYMFLFFPLALVFFLCQNMS